MSREDAIDERIEANLNRAWQMCKVEPQKTQYWPASGEAAKRFIEVAERRFAFDARLHVDVVELRCRDRFPEWC